MSLLKQEERVLIVNPGRGGLEFGIPCDDPAGGGFAGTSGIHYNRTIAADQVLLGVPNATANAAGLGAVYLSNIHGGVGSDVVNRLSSTGAPNLSVPAFPNPEVTGYFNTGPDKDDVELNGYINSEKIQRTASDKAAGATNAATVWQSLDGRSRLNFSLWIATASVLPDFMALELYRDLNVLDKVAGRFGVGLGPTDTHNAQLVGRWNARGAKFDQNKPNFGSVKPIDIPAGCNLYLLFRNITGTAVNRVVGSIWFS